jgi:hypothetical protein
MPPPSQPIHPSTYIPLYGYSSPSYISIKVVLRRLARNLGLTRCASLQKRAIQFGTRIANKNPYPNASPNPSP